MRSVKKHYNIKYSLCNLYIYGLLNDLSYLFIL